MKRSFSGSGAVRHDDRGADAAHLLIRGSPPSEHGPRQGRPIRSKLRIQRRRMRIRKIHRQSDRNQGRSCAAQSRRPARSLRPVLASASCRSGSPQSANAPSRPLRRLMARQGTGRCRPARRRLVARAARCRPARAGPAGSTGRPPSAMAGEIRSRGSVRLRPSSSARATFAWRRLADRSWPTPAPRCAVGHGTRPRCRPGCHRSV